MWTSTSGRKSPTRPSTIPLSAIVPSTTVKPRVPGQVFPSPGGEIVDDEDLVFACEQEVRDVRADLSQPAGDKDFHSYRPFLWRSVSRLTIAR